jgi:hypothetical protein
MPGDHETQRIAEEIRRLETRRAEVEAMIKRDRSASQQRQLHQHLANVDRTLTTLRQQQRQFS